MCARECRFVEIGNDICKKVGKYLLDYIDNSEENIGEESPERHGFIRFSEMNSIGYGDGNKSKNHHKDHTDSPSYTSREEEIDSIEEASDKYKESGYVEEKISEGSFHGGIIMRIFFSRALDIRVRLFVCRTCSEDKSEYLLYC